MMSRFKIQSGFSLIELMVVMAIMAIMMALTGGLASQNIDKQERLVEVEKVKQLFKRLSYQAYYTGYNIQVKLENSKITVVTFYMESTIQFKQLKFVDSDYLVSTKAFVIPAQFSVQWNETHRDISIDPMFKIYEN